IASITAAAAEAGRGVDPEHFGLSIPYAAAEPDASTVAALQARRPDVVVEEIFPIGPAQLRSLVGRLVDQGLSKFVIRPVGSPVSWRTDLDRLAQTVLDLQT
ncbi:MAG: hypothetical protein JWL72_1013, partial [Ilumatobacteraceae bacterium]|nr:hypothetical protein [Ilumatobacteraceae bacterium]